MYTRARNADAVRGKIERNEKDEASKRGKSMIGFPTNFSRIKSIHRAVIMRLTMFLLAGTQTDLCRWDANCTRFVSWRKNSASCADESRDNRYASGLIKNKSRSRRAGIFKPVLLSWPKNGFKRNASPPDCREIGNYDRFFEWTGVP